MKLAAASTRGGMFEGVVPEVPYFTCCRLFRVDIHIFSIDENWITGSDSMKESGWVIR